jgi:hypothetical protein
MGSLPCAVNRRRLLGTDKTDRQTDGRTEQREGSATERRRRRAERRRRETEEDGGGGWEKLSTMDVKQRKVKICRKRINEIDREKVKYAD